MQRMLWAAMISEPGNDKARAVMRWILAAFYAAAGPANFKHAIDGIDLPYITGSRLYHGPRLAFQPVIVWWALYCSKVIDWPWRR